MTLEEALAAPGRKVHASGDVTDGMRRLTIYSLATGGATHLLETRVPVAEHDAVVAKLKSGGCEPAETEFLTKIVWVPKTDGVEVYDRRKRQLDVTGDRATLEDGSVVERADIAQVYSWASEDYAGRGIMATLKSGKEVDLVSEISLAATGDPTYNRNDLLADSGWCVTLGRVIATWAGSTFENRI